MPFAYVVVAEITAGAVDVPQSGGGVGGWYANSP